MVALPFCESCGKYGTYVILLHLLYSIIGISNKGLLQSVSQNTQVFLKANFLAHTWIPAHVVSDLQHA